MIKMENEYFLILEITLFSVTALVHILGIYVLIKHSRLIARNQRTYLLSLSASEMSLSIGHIMLNIVYLVCSSHLPKSIWVAVIEIIYYDGVWIVNLTTMIMLTLDRFAEVLLNLKYELYITRRKTLVVVGSIWLFGILTTVTFIILHFIYNIHYFNISYRYIYPILDTVVVSNAIMVYSYIYIKRFNINKQILPSDQDYALPSNSVGKQRKKRKFFVPFLILITFVLFVYIPDLIYFTNISLRNEDDWFTRVSTVLYSINMLLDAVIYIFLQRGVRKFIVRKWIQLNVR